MRVPQTKKGGTIRSPVILIDGNNLVGMIQEFKIQLEAA